MKPHSPWLVRLEQIQADLTSGLLEKHGLRCVTGDWLDSAVLKIQKPSWTDGGPGQGVFFSIWLGDKEIRKNRFNYNIHALKLRLREGYAIKPGDFASAFRGKFASQSGRWPNVCTDYGPQTLMQGWMPLDAKTFRRDVAGLVDSFVAIHGIIDVLLEERRKS
jgi:hypothetical protein